MMRKRLRAVADEHCFPKETELRLESGDPADELMSVADEQDAALLVVASRGRRDVAGALLGSVASTLMWAAECPVVLVPPGAIAPLDAASMQSVVCGVAGDETDIPVLRLAADLAQRLRGNLQAVHAYDPTALDPAEAGPQRKLNNALEHAGVEARSVVLPLPAAEALQRAAEEGRAGLIIVGSQAHDKLGSVLHGSVTTQLAYEAGIPIVVLPPEVGLDPGSGHYEVLTQSA
jgi:nucleotide-binding universal stress UspA family protein